ncbi:MAG: hypothetical protein EXR76_09235 [Myxococcales bacterium]|nr:hypothetical protein [Myxococcales bacterium]
MPVLPGLRADLVAGPLVGSAFALVGCAFVLVGSGFVLVGCASGTENEEVIDLLIRRPVADGAMLLPDPDRGAAVETDAVEPGQTDGGLMDRARPLDGELADVRDVAPAVPDRAQNVDASVPPSSDGPPPSPDVPASEPGRDCEGGCAHLDDPCRVGVCDRNAGACRSDQRVDGTLCDDGSACTMGDVCIGGGCEPGARLDCGAMATPCVDAACRNDVGCVVTPRGDGAACQGPDLCQQGGACNAGVCEGATPVDCTGLDGLCAAGQCDGASGECIPSPRNEGSRCDDLLDLCAEQRCVSGACAALVPIDCGAIAGDCNEAHCEPGVGCVAVPVGLCAVCRDQPGLCDGAGRCLAFGGGSGSVRTGFEDGQVPAGFVGGADAPWNVGAARAFEGAMVLRSGPVGDGETSLVDFAFDVEISATLRFRYRVSSEDRYDAFQFTLDGAQRFAIDGEEDWQPFEAVLGPGRHTLRFLYEKDLSLERGEDAAFVDAFELDVGCPAAPCFEGRQTVEACLACPAAEGSACDVGACAAGTCQGGACQSLPRSECLPCGEGFEVCNGGACGDFTFAAFDMEGGLPAVFETGGDTGWGAANQPHRGNQSIASGALGDDEQGFTRTSVDVPQPALLQFWYRTSTETCCDKLRFFVDGAERLEMGGNHEWTRHTSSIGAGLHTLEWRYEKDSSVATGQDKVWVDDASITALPICGP